MSYNTIHAAATDETLRNRVTAAAAQEDAFDPEMVSWNMRWAIAAASDIEAAYASALAGDNPNPGGDESVITDGMILSKVQALWDGTPGTVPPT